MEKRTMPPQDARTVFSKALDSVADQDRDAGRMVRRHFRLADRRTSICLHPEEWSMLENVSRRLGYDLKAMINEIDRTRGASSVPSAVRVFMLNYWRDLARANTARKLQAKPSSTLGSSVMTESAPQLRIVAARA